MYKNFEAELTICEKKYLKKLSFKFYNEVIPDNFSNAKSKFNSLQEKFDKDPSLFENYSVIIKDYRSQGIFEEVKDSGKLGNMYYLTHPLVVRTGKYTAKLRIVFDAS